MNSAYGYTQRNLFDHPETYFYSEYTGKIFFHQWLHDRDKFVVPPDTYSPELLFSPQQESSPESMEIHTHIFFDTVYWQLSSGELNSENQKKIDLVVKRFEITKYVFYNYSQDLRLLSSSSFLDRDLYLKFGIILEFLFTKTGNIPYLNSLLKIIDIISSDYENLTDPQKLAGSFLAKREREIILGLLNEREIGL